LCSCNNKKSWACIRSKLTFWLLQKHRKNYTRHIEVNKNDCHFCPCWFVDFWIRSIEWPDARDKWNTIIIIHCAYIYFYDTAIKVQLLGLIILTYRRGPKNPSDFYSSIRKICNRNNEHFLSSYINSIRNIKIYNINSEK
jgi:hypothetical protein